MFGRLKSALLPWSCRRETATGDRADVGDAASVPAPPPDAPAAPESPPQSAVLRMTARFPHLLPPDTSPHAYAAWCADHGFPVDLDDYAALCELAGVGACDAGFPPDKRITKYEAEMDVVRMMARGANIPAQGVLANRWRRSPATISRWLTEWERLGIVARSSHGRRNRVEAAATSASSVIHRETEKAAA